MHPATALQSDVIECPPATTHHSDVIECTLPRPPHQDAVAGAVREALQGRWFVPVVATPDDASAVAVPWSPDVSPALLCVAVNFCIAANNCCFYSITPFHTRWTWHPTPHVVCGIQAPRVVTVADRRSLGWQVR